jgi:hypothetical protein
MLIRYFAAARAAAGVEQETLEFFDGAALTGHPPTHGGATGD